MQQNFTFEYQDVHSLINVIKVSKIINQYHFISFFDDFMNRFSSKSNVAFLRSQKTHMSINR